MLADARAQRHAVASASGPTSCPRPGTSTRPWPSVSATSSTPTSSRGSARSRRSSSATCRARTGTRPGGRDATSTGTCGSSPSRPGSRRSSRAASARTRRSSAGSSRTRCRCTAEPGTSAEITAWARLVVQAVRSSGATQPISLGDGAWGVEVSGNDNGYSLRELAPLVDFVGPHVYPMQDDQVRQFLTAAFVCELSGGFGKPVVLEEFGVTSDFASDDRGGRLLPAGPAHVAARRRPRLDRLEQLRLRRPARRGSVPPPRVRDAFRADRPERAVPSRSSGCWPSSPRSSRGLAGEGWEPVKGGAAIVVPEHFERVLPFTTPAYRQDIRDNLLQSYVAALEADLPVQLVRERDGLHTDAPLILAPCAKLLTAPGIDRLRELARRRRDRLPLLLRGQHDEPARAVACLAGGDLRCPARAPLRARRPDRSGTRPCSSSSATSATSTPARGSGFRVAGEASARAFLPVEPAGAEIVAVDGQGRPALLQHRARRRPAPCSAPIRSSTWRRGRPGSTRRTPGASTRRSPRRRGRAAGQGRRPAGARRPCPQRRNREPRSSSTARATRSRSSRSSRATSHRRAVRHQPCRSRSIRSASAWLRVRPWPQVESGRQQPSSTSSAMDSRRSPHAKGVMRSRPHERRQRTVTTKLRTVSASELASRRNDVPTRRK